MIIRQKQIILLRFPEAEKVVLIKQPPATRIFREKNEEPILKPPRAVRVVRDAAEIVVLKPPAKLRILRDNVGYPGKSAYQSAVDHGFTGTIEEWLESLKGEDGDPATNLVHSVAGRQGDVVLGTSDLSDFQAAVNAILAALKGIAGGIMGLDGTGKAPAANLPSYVDDVLEYANFAALPAVGEIGKIYVLATAYTIGNITSYQFRWTGTQYTPVSPSPASTDGVPEGLVNKYWTAARTLATNLTGFVAGAGSITAGDTVLTALQKIVGNLAALTVNSILDFFSQMKTRQVDLIATTNVNIASAPAFIDGVAPSAGLIIGLVNQTMPSQNGIYTSAGVGAAMVRLASYSSDANIRGSTMWAQRGSFNAGMPFQNTNTAAIVLGVTAITFTQAMAGINGISISGRNHSLAASGVAAGNYQYGGSYTVQPVVDSFGRFTSIAAYSIEITSYQVTDFVPRVLAIAGGGGMTRGETVALLEGAI